MFCFLFFVFIFLPSPPCSPFLNKSSLTYPFSLFREEYGDDSKAKEDVKKISKSMGSGYSANSHLFHVCAVGDLAMCKVLVSKMKADPQV